MNGKLSRRGFIKLSGLALTSVALNNHPLAFNYSQPVWRNEERDNGLLARVAIKEIDLRSEPRDDAPIIGKRYRDQVVHIYYELIPPDAPVFYNRLWYRVWGGYLHSAHLQIVKIRLNDPLSYVPESGQLCEITVPYTKPYLKDPFKGWQPWPSAPLYYDTVHWATGVEAGPDGSPWYQVTSELYDGFIYYVPAAHLRPIPPEEWAPIAVDVPPEKKKLVVSLKEQTLRAYEYNQVVFTTRISSGIPSAGTSPNGIPTATQKGEYRIYSKMPTKHMGSSTGNPDGNDGDSFSLPGVPWTSFFNPNGGVAFHGTYWHNNFGLQMSHGCINMRNPDARWLFRWSTPVFDTKIESHDDWEHTGNGTLVIIE
jgi:lipoprotein-anchoring transpeptidase ErfK/SrfK